MLLTTCPNCSAQFKVLTDQLNVRQGRVMCGRCRQVFDAFQSLTRGPDTTGPHLPLEKYPPKSNEVSPVPAPPNTGPFQEGDASAIVLEDLESQESNVPGAASGNRPAIAQDPVNVPNSLLAGPAGSRRQEQRQSAAGWIALCIVAVIGLLAHATYVFRADLANHWPQLRPWLTLACGPLGCDLPFGREDASMKIEASDLIEQPGKSNRIQVTATLVNRGRISMDYPWLELRLTDNANQAVLTKAVRPQDYLGAPPPANAHIPPGSEVFINFTAEVFPKVPASGYSVRAYYP